MPNATPSPALPDILKGYEGKDMPLPQYAGLVAVFGTLAASLLAAENARDDEPPPLGLGDLVLLGLATHKLSRLIAKDRVTAPFRAPFTKFVKDDGAGEVEEESRGEGMQKAVGDLGTCPFCVSPWVALGLTAGIRFAPRATRLFCGILSSVTASHFLHQAYVVLKEKNECARRGRSR